MTLMKELWNRTFELFRRHFALWVPCSTAVILVFLLGRLQRAWAYWLMTFLSTQHSVFGGESQSADIALVQQRAMMIGFPIGLVEHSAEISFFVMALVVTNNLVQKIIQEQTPDTATAIREIASRFREILVFTFKYMTVMALFMGLSAVLATSSLTPERFHAVALSKTFLYSFGLLVEICLAWLLVPSAIRLLRPPDSPKISIQGRKFGTYFAVLTSAAAVLLQFLIHKAEATVILDNRWEFEAATVINTLVINVPQIFLFIALALLAIQNTEVDTSLTTEPPNTWLKRLQQFHY
jgi:hypothetical protein